jgi:hypothetical protein
MGAQALADPLAARGGPALAEQSCQAVVGLAPGEAHYDTCVSSLSASLLGVAQAHRLQQAHDQCRSQGLAISSPALARCVLKASETASSPGEERAPAAVPVRLAQQRPVKSYFYASSEVRSQRERQACADLGLDPVSAAFSDCVTSLSTALAQADNPQP